MTTLNMEKQAKKNKENQKPPINRLPRVEPGSEVQRKTLGDKEISGPNYRMLRPEVKMCLDKIIYQLDLCRNTLGLIEKRISNSENSLLGVVEFIKHEDITYVSKYNPNDLIIATTHKEGR